MLVYFSAENFRSINGAIELNMRAAPRLRRLDDHVRTPIEDDPSVRVLKSAVLYGANASGKSNIIKAVDFVKRLIFVSDKKNSMIKYDRFKLVENEKDDSSFYFEFVICEIHFSYELKIDKSQILYEELKIHHKDNELKIFCRKYEGDKYKVETEIKLSDEESAKLKFISEITEKNKTLLGEFSGKNLKEQFSDKILSPILCTVLFFKYKLITIFPDTQYGGLIDDLRDNEQDCNDCQYINLLQSFDTGISKIRFDPVSLSLFPDAMINSIKEDIDDESAITVTYQGREYKFELDKDENLSALELKSIHKLENDKEIMFNLSDESDGTLRLLDLLPSITVEHETQNDTTYLIDEFDRSLHPNLSKRFIEVFLNGTENDTQLIVTTHEAGLLDKNLLRRDEIWFVQKEWDGSSKLYSLDDYSPRFDKDIYKAYLEGRYGGVPLLSKTIKKNIKKDRMGCDE